MSEDRIALRTQIPMAQSVIVLFTAVTGTVVGWIVIPSPPSLGGSFPFILSSVWIRVSMGTGTRAGVISPVL